MDLKQLRSVSSQKFDDNSEKLLREILWFANVRNSIRTSVGKIQQRNLFP